MGEVLLMYYTGTTGLKPYFGKCKTSFVLVILCCNIFTDVTDDMLSGISHELIMLHVRDYRLNSVLCQHKGPILLYLDCNIVTYDIYCSYVPVTC